MRPGLIGRVNEQGALRAWLEPTDEPRGRRAMEIVGEAGVGKSSLLAWCADAVRDRGGVVLSAACSELEHEIAWSCLSTLIAPVRTRVPAAIETMLHAPAGTTTTLQGVAVALGELLRDLANDGELVVMLDDSMWIDPASRLALTAAMRSLAPARWICARRSDAEPAFDLARLFGEGASTLKLGGLRLADVGTLLAQLLGRRPSHQDVEAIHRLTLGNPLHVAEIAASLRSSEHLVLPTHPLSIEASYASRLRLLDATQRHVALVAALALPATVGLLERALPGHDVIGTLGVLERAGVVRVDGNEIAFTHPLMHRAVRTSAPGAEALRVHRLLAEQATSAVDRARHLAAATFEPDDRVADVLADAAAELVRRGAPAEAAAMSQKAAELTTDPSRRRRRVVDAANHWTAAARWDLARPLYEASWQWVEQHRDAPGALELGLEVARGMLVDVVALDELVAATLHRAEVLAASPRASGILLALISRTQQLLNVPTGLALAHRGMALASASGDAEARWVARVALANALTAAGEPVDRAMLDDPPPLRPDELWSPFQTACETLVFLEEHACARRYLEELVAACRRYHRPGPMLLMSSLTMELEYRAGNWDRVLEIDRTLDDQASWQVDDYDRDANVVRVLAARGRRDLLEATAQPDLDRVELPPIAALSVMSSWGFAELCTGNWSTAVALLRRAHEAAAALEVEDDRVSPYHADLIEALVRIDAVDEAAQVSMALDSIAERSGEPEAAADSARCRAIIAAAQGNLAVADAEFATALTLSDAHRRPFDRARTLLAVGEHQRRRRRRAASRGTLARARTIFEQLGAHAWIERVDSELALLGRGSDARSLTTAELRVARLVAAGRRNKEIAAELTISIRTVEWTVAAIYRKLGVSTRVAIGQELLRGADPAAPPGADAPR